MKSSMLSLERPRRWLGLDLMDRWEWRLASLGVVVAVAVLIINGGGRRDDAQIDEIVARVKPDLQEMVETTIRQMVPGTGFVSLSSPVQVQTVDDSDEQVIILQIAIPPSLLRGCANLPVAIWLTDADDGMIKRIWSLVLQPRQEAQRLALLMPKEQRPAEFRIGMMVDRRCAARAAP